MKWLNLYIINLIILNKSQTDLNLENKVIIVTGGSKGIGNGICNLLVEETAYFTE